MYEHIAESVEYIEENVLCEDDGSEEFYNLKELFNSTLLNKCECDKYTDCKNCHSGVNYTWNDFSKELVLSKIMQTRPILECFNLCACNSKGCINRLIQFGSRQNLDISYSDRFQSTGVVTKSDIPKGGFICEYAGELLTSHEAFRRQQNAENSDDNYILHFNEVADGNGEKYFSIVIDPTYRGNIGRYLNHSCEPNCDLYSVRVDCPIPKVAIFAIRDIKVGEELCFDYGNINCSKKLSKKLCLCGTRSCSLYLPKLDI